MLHARRPHYRNWTRILSLVALGWWAVLAASTAAFGQAAVRPETEPDQLCEMLFDNYLVVGKINSSTVRAAVEILSDRGRTTGFAPFVLAAVKDPENYRADKRRMRQDECIRILGKMLETDAAIRWNHRQFIERNSGAKSDRAAPQQALPQATPQAEVSDSGRVPRAAIDLLITQGKEADRHMVDHYLVALVRSRTPDAQPLFEQVFHNRDGKGHRDSARFHAAIGLAQMGDPSAYEWLVRKSIDNNSSVWVANPSFERRDSLGHCCMSALRQLTELDHNDWQAWSQWWEQVERDRLPKGRVRLFDR